MEISSGLNQKVSFFPKNTGNNINMTVDDNNHQYVTNIFSPELNEQLKNKNQVKTPKRKRINKRLNTIDSDYLLDEPEAPEIQDENSNFFITGEEKKVHRNIRKAINYFFENIPLVNYIYLRQKEKKIQKTVEVLKDITQNVDDLLSTAVPYGEESEVYSTIARNLTDAANVIGQSKKDL